MTFKEERVRIPFGEKQLDATLCIPLSANEDCLRVLTAVILTHGAGGDMNFRHLVSLAKAIALEGILSIRFTCKSLNLGYRVKAYRAAWVSPVYLNDTFSISNMFLGGRSMGARAATAVARQLSESGEAKVQGLVCLSFPLHPPGQTGTHRQRSEDLRELPEDMCVLFVSGTEDNMCDRVIFEGVLDEMKASATVNWLEKGNHGLTVKGRSEESVLNEVNSNVLNWISKYTTLQQIPEEARKVHKLLHSRLLQTEIRVLYELQYVLNNSFRQQKSFRALKQVEQCIHRLKEMKLDSALGELMELCPSQAQRQIASDSKGDITVPSQPALEWYCLKVLGAAQLMSCVLQRCTRAFVLSQQHLQSEEFVLLNVVLTSMLSRLWVFFRGILASLAPLYEQILKLWKDVSQAQHMPYLRDFPLPTDILEFLGPSDSPLSGMEPAPAPESLRKDLEKL
ncbi:testis-expressed protein 30, partial [Aplochiton taeniatus]